MIRWRFILVTQLTVIFFVPLLILGIVSARHFPSAPIWLNNPPPNLASERPDYVMLGNSMLPTSINATLLGKMIGSSKVSQLWWGASRGPHWYLMLKHHVANVGVRPKAVFIFFADDSLTSNSFQGVSHSRLELVRLMTQEWPALHRALRGSPLTLLRTQFELIRWGILEELHDAVMDGVTCLAYRMAFPASDISGAFQRPWNSAFALETRRRDSLSRIPRAETVAYEKDLEQSFLPAMMETAYEHKLRLIFVRTQRRPDSEAPATDSPAAREYMRKLEFYVESHGHRLFDFGNDREFSPEHYGDSYHLNPEHRDRYTKRFYARVETVFQ